ncbi:hypothetical protein CDAR_458461 [Caerostris darwini]|uniref:Transposase n=1 Tax=Caerostris darwini TaxID=1538125 RepID=A0AAV4NVW3_9ARAC|nr:hypothetical protein CDAR_458461 [Caerostris darwini]
MSNNVLERTFRFMFKANKRKQGVKGAPEFIPRAICYGRKNFRRPSKLVIFLEVYCQFRYCCRRNDGTFSFLDQEAGDLHSLWIPLKKVIMRMFFNGIILVFWTITQ